MIKKSLILMSLFITMILVLGIVSAAVPTTVPEKSNGCSWWQKLLGKCHSADKNTDKSANQNKTITKKGMLPPGKNKAVPPKKTIKNGNQTITGNAIKKVPARK